MAYCPVYCSQDSDCAEPYKCTSQHCCPEGEIWQADQNQCGPCRNNQDCGEGKWCDNQHCCPNGYYWNEEKQGCAEGESCDILWTPTTQIAYNQSGYTYNYWNQPVACCYQDWYNAPGFYWTDYTIY